MMIHNATRLCAVEGNGELGAGWRSAHAVVPSIAALTDSKSMYERLTGELVFWTRMMVCLPPLPAALIMMKVVGANMNIPCNQSFFKPMQRSGEARFGFAQATRKGRRRWFKPLGERRSRVCVCLVRHLVEVDNRNRTENKWERGSRGVSGASVARHHCQGGIFIPKKNGIVEGTESPTLWESCYM